MGYIYVVVFCWFFIREGSLDFNLNLCLFIFFKKSFLNGYIFNFFYFFGIIFVYGVIFVIFLSFNFEFVCLLGKFYEIIDIRGVYLNGIVFIIFGCGFFF